MLIRAATSGDADAIWAIMEPIVRAGERIRCLADMEKEKVLSYWLSAEHEFFSRKTMTRSWALTSCGPTRWSARIRWSPPANEGFR
jgi:hypothetical protein